MTIAPLGWVLLGAIIGTFSGFVVCIGWWTSHAEIGLDTSDDDTTWTDATDLELSLLLLTEGA